MPRIWKPTTGYSGTRYAGARKRRYELDLVRATQRAEQHAGMRGPFVGSARTAAYVAAVAAQETKYFDTGFQTSVTWSGATWADSELPADNYVNSSGSPAAYTDSALIPSANGSAYGQVDGNRYKLLRIRFRGKMITAALSDQADMPNGPIMVRLLMVEDSQPNGAQAQGEDVLQDFGTANENIFSFLRIPNGLGRFRIVADKTIQLQAIAVGGDNSNAGAFTNSVGFAGAKFKLNFAPKVPVDVNIKSGNATPTIAGLINKNYFVLVAGTDSGGTAKAITISGACRAYYKD